MSYEEKYMKTWEPVFAEFEELYPNIADEMYDWYPSGELEITVKTKDGKIVAYDFVDKHLTYIYDVDNKRTYSDEQSWRDEFSYKLSEKMRIRCVGRDWLSDKTGISIMSISKYLNGKATPSAYNLERIARALRCTVREILPDRY